MLKRQRESIKLFTKRYKMYCLYYTLFCVLLTCLFYGLNYFGVVNWDSFWVFSPMYAYFASLIIGVVYYSIFDILEDI